MNFSENLKQIRKEKHLSQEQLADLLDVSRQAVSKWEQGQGYPEVEKLLLLSKKLNVSLDTLMFSESVESKTVDDPSAAGSIVITSPNENVIAVCYKVVTSQKMRGGANTPQYALFGVDRGGTNFFGPPTTFLGWYANEEQISKEIEAIHQAISNGIPNYTLQYSVKTERRWMRVKIVED